MPLAEVHVLEGELGWKLDDELSATPAGSFVFIPRGVAHCFQNVGEGTARMVITFAPAGMEVVGPPLAESDPL